VTCEPAQTSAVGYCVTMVREWELVRGRCAVCGNTNAREKCSVTRHNHCSFSNSGGITARCLPPGRFRAIQRRHLNHITLQCRVTSSSLISSRSQRRDLFCRTPPTKFNNEQSSQM
jgi:hypothetical protein